MGKLTGLSESNARINLRSLVQKLAVDEHTTYDCAAGQGRTYRVYHPVEILRRRDEAGLRWVMRRTLAVVFVDPETKLPLFIKTGTKSGPGLISAPALILINLAREHLQQYGPVGPETIARFIGDCRRANPALTADQLAAAIHRQALQMKPMTPEQRIAFLIDTVPRNL
jgi:hypothetical protein